MTPARQLQELILATPACAEHIHTANMPKISADEARAKDQAVADALASAGALTKICSRKIGEDDVLRELGVTAGDAVLNKLDALAGEDSRVRRAMRLLGNGDLDVGHPETQDMIGALPTLTDDEKSALKAMAKQTITVSAAQVSNALRGPWGDE